MSWLDSLKIVVGDKTWNKKRRVPYFRLHKLLGTFSLGLEMKPEESRKLDIYWDKEVDDPRSVYWSTGDALEKVYRMNMVPKVMIARFMGYYIIGLVGLIFVFLPTAMRSDTLTACGLDPNQARNLIYLSFLMIKY